MKSAALQVANTSAADDCRTDQDQPLRLLVLRERLGELPWIVETIATLMAPVEIVQVSGLANALWRLGRERFDSVLLDLNPANQPAREACRRHIAEIGAIPVLDLNDGLTTTGGLLEPLPASTDARSSGSSRKARRAGSRRAAALPRAI